MPRPSTNPLEVCTRALRLRSLPTLSEGLRTYLRSNEPVQDARDGRWRFETHGKVQPFEDPAIYRAPRIRDRFDRALLVRYLDGLGIFADDPTFFGSAVLFVARTLWTASLAEARKERPSPTAPIGEGDAYNLSS